jgi:DNA recombination protein RmuC
MERVEYAVRLPGRNEGDQPVWLPMDAKFPHEDYQRLVEASEKGDSEAVAAAAKALEARLRGQARDIRDKYIIPPHTTDFAILFLPSEGLYAEALRRPGLTEALQQEYRVIVAGPTTLGALLNSLQMGFRTLAIQQRSSEVWKVLGAVKTEFGKFGEVLTRVKKKLDEASSQIEQTEVRTRAINRQLRQVETIPISEGGPDPAALGIEEEAPENPMLPELLPRLGK